VEVGDAPLETRTPALWSLTESPSCCAAHQRGCESATPRHPGYRVGRPLRASGLAFSSRLPSAFTRHPRRVAGVSSGAAETAPVLMGKQQSAGCATCRPMRSQLQDEGESCAQQAQAVPKRGTQGCQEPSAKASRTAKRPGFPDPFGDRGAGFEPATFGLCGRQRGCHGCGYGFLEPFLCAWVPPSFVQIAPRFRPRLQLGLVRAHISGPRRSL
jgi:hypothetical protein